MIVALDIIQTEYMAADDSHGSRIRATANFGTKTIDRDLTKNIDECHEQAAKELALRDGYNVALIGGVSRDGEERIFLMLDKYNPLIKAANALSNLLDKEAGHYTPISGDDWENEWVKNGLEIVSEVLKITDNIK